MFRSGPHSAVTSDGLGNRQTAERAFRRAFFIRKRNAAATALACAAVGISTTYLASGSPLLGTLTAVVTIIATAVLTVGVYVLYEPVADNLEEFAEIMQGAEPRALDVRR